MSENLPAPVPQPAPPFTLGYAAESYRRYPGESVTFHGRVEVREPSVGFRLQISLPDELEPGDAICTTNNMVPRIAHAGGANHLLWDVAEVQAGQIFEFKAAATVLPAEEELSLETYALVWPLPFRGGTVPALQEAVAVAVESKGRYLRYLPALYAEDELMGRFLMLFESFWSPIVGQIEQMPVYFDPRMTQSELLPWLASWIGLTLDERWPEERRRRMLGSAVALFRKRGTRRGLQEYLEIFTGRRPQIVEQGANNLRLGANAHLGPSVALGTSNQPHTFTVIMNLPPVVGANGDEAHRAKLEAERRRMIETIIDAEKPAHTDYTLRIDVAESA